MISAFKKKRITLEEVGLFVSLLLKYARLFLLLLAASWTAGLFLYVYSRPVYSATSLISIRFELPRINDTQVTYQDSNIDHLTNVMTSPLFVERVARKCGLNTSYATIMQNSIKKLRVRHARGGGGINIRIWSFSRELAAQWGEVSLAEYKAWREEERNRKKEHLLEVYAIEMARVRQKIEEERIKNEKFEMHLGLEEAKMELANYRYVPQRITFVSQKIKDINLLLEELKTHPDWTAEERLTYLSSREKLYRDQLVVGELTSRSEKSKDGRERPVLSRENQSLNSFPWESSLSKIKNLRTEAARLDKIYLPSHPKYKAIAKELQEAENAIFVAWEQALSRLKLLKYQLEKEKEELDEYLPIYKERSNRVTKLLEEEKFYRLRKGRDSTRGMEKIYETAASVLKRYEDATDLERMEVTYMGLLALSDTPVSPNRMKVVLGATALAIFLSVVVGFIMEYLNHTVTALEDAEDLLGVPGLGVVPQIKQENDQKILGILAHDQHSQKEVFRVIRTNLLLGQSLPSERKVLCITSAMPKEGKSLVSSNLAVSFAKLGEKVILLDCDFHQGKQHRTFGVQSRPGMGGLLSGEVSFEEAIQATSIPNLDIITKDKKEGNVTELFSQETFTILLEKLKERYDRVIIDSPPVLGISETCVIAPKANGVIFVLWSTKTPISQIQTSLKYLRGNGAELFGCVVNRLDLGVASNYYYYYYYSDYYYNSYHNQLPVAENES